MGNVTSAIRKYIDEEIRLSQKDISETVRSREWFLNRIANVIEGRENEPVLYSSDPFVHFGSYFKGTKVKDVDEYDVLVVIDSNTGCFHKSGVTIGSGLGSANPNFKYQGRKYYKSDGSGISPTKMLNWMKGVVEEVTDAFGGEAPIRDGQAITATIKSHNLKIDIIPAGVFESTSDDSVFYNIPKGDINNGWILTSPRKDIDLLNSVAESKDNFRNVIRIAKRIKDQDAYNFLIPSFAIETAIVYYGLLCGNYESFDWQNDLYLDVRGALLHLARNFRHGTILDPFDMESNLISGVENLTWYADRIDGIVEELDYCATSVTDQEKVYERVRRTFENE